MNERALFDSAEQAATVTFNMVNRLAIVVGWIVFWFFHLTLCVALLFALWAFDLSAQAVETTFLSATQERPLSIALAMGLSVTGVTAGYLKLARWLNTKVFGGWLIEYLIQDSKP